MTCRVLGDVMGGLPSGTFRAAKVNSTHRGGGVQVGRYIQSRGGVVAAEELAPFLDPPPKVEGDDSVDEGYVVPALVRFGGSPEVDEQGNLLYRFESEPPPPPIPHPTSPP